MPVQFVIGLFPSKGIAEDACNRLRHEGVPEQHISLMLLHETAEPVPQAVRPELAALSVDPLIVGDARRSFVRFIRNGETAVFVRAHSDDEAEIAVGTLRQYAPIRIRVAAAQAGAVTARDVPLTSETV
jgi:hypothetical protein